MLVFIHSIAHGSASVAWLRASLLFTMTQYTVHRFASANRSGLSSVIVTVRASTTANWSGRVMDPVDICGGASDGADTARSSDHFTSSAVTGEPSCHVASGRRRMVMTRRSGLML